MLNFFFYKNLDNQIEIDYQVIFKTDLKGDSEIVTPIAVCILILFLLVWFSYYFMRLKLNRLDLEKQVVLKVFKKAAEEDARSYRSSIVENDERVHANYENILKRKMT